MLAVVPEAASKLASIVVLDVSRAFHFVVFEGAAVLEGANLHQFAKPLKTVSTELSAVNLLSIG
jgi:hypothetical protein